MKTGTIVGKRAKIIVFILGPMVKFVLPEKVTHLFVVLLTACTCAARVACLILKTLNVLGIHYPPQFRHSFKKLVLQPFFSKQLYAPLQIFIRTLRRPSFLEERNEAPFDPIDHFTRIELIPSKLAKNSFFFFSLSLSLSSHRHTKITRP